MATDEKKESKKDREVFEGDRWLPPASALVKPTTAWEHCVCESRIRVEESNIRACGMLLILGNGVCPLHQPPALTHRTLRM
jgi:hypothetical protein